MIKFKKRHQKHLSKMKTGDTKDTLYFKTTALAKYFRNSGQYMNSVTYNMSQRIRSSF